MKKEVAETKPILTTRLKSVTLLVEPSAADRERLGDWLEDAGFDVVSCPGPAVVSSCPGIRGQACSLVEAADITILDERVLTAADDQTKSRVLVDRYVASQKPVLMLTGAEGQTHPLENASVAVASGLTSRSVLAAIDELTVR